MEYVKLEKKEEEEEEREDNLWFDSLKGWSYSFLRVRWCSHTNGPFLRIKESSRDLEQRSRERLTAI